MQLGKVFCRTRGASSGCHLTLPASSCNPSSQLMVPSIIRQPKWSSLKTSPRQTLNPFQLKRNWIPISRSHSLFDDHINIGLFHPNLVQPLRKTQLFNKHMQPPDSISIAERQSFPDDSECLRNLRGIVSKSSRQDNGMSLCMGEIESATDCMAYLVVQAHLGASEAHSTQPRAVLSGGPR